MGLWSTIKRWWANHFTGFDRREKWGYAVWFSFAVIVLVPEFWAAFWKDSAPFPTISATTGALEYDHPILGLVVVTVIVLCAYSAFRFPPVRTGVVPPPGEPDRGWMGEDTLIPYRTPLGNRFTLSTTPVPEIRAWIYFTVALGVILGATTWAVLTSDVDDEYRTGQTLYGLIALFLIVIPSLLAWPKWWAREVPFPTLFATVRSLERRLRFVAFAVAAGLVMLLLHIVLYPWPSIIPDLNRLHQNYKCHPLEPAKHPLTEKEQAACDRRDEKAKRPAPDAP
jgi:hypothetical protein